MCLLPYLEAIALLIASSVRSRKGLAVAIVLFKVKQKFNMDE
jgi:hypothetical protein